MTALTDYRNHHQQQQQQNDHQPLKSTIAANKKNKLLVLANNKTKMECKSTIQKVDLQIAQKVDELEKRLRSDTASSMVDVTGQVTIHPRLVEEEQVQERDDQAGGDLRNMMQEFAENDRLFLAQTCEAQEQAIVRLQNERSRDNMILNEAKRQISELRAQLQLQNENQSILEQDIVSLKEENQKFKKQLERKKRMTLKPWEKDRTLYQRSDQSSVSEEVIFSLPEKVNAALKNQDTVEEQKKPKQQERWIAPMKSDASTVVEENDDADTTTLSQICSDTSSSTPFFLDTCDDSSISLSTHGSLQQQQQQQQTNPNYEDNQCKEVASDKSSGSEEVGLSDDNCKWVSFVSERICL